MYRPRILWISVFALLGCETRVINHDNTVAEVSYCSTVSSFSAPTTTVSGTAQYEKGVISGSGLNVTSPTTQNIRYAEVIVKNGTGAVVQCTETDGSGAFSFIVPQGDSYTIYVNSRGDNSVVQASVLNLPSENQYYSISKSITASGPTANAGTILASATGTLEGGAFNIFDQIVKANLYLSTQANNCSTHISGCLNFSVAPKIQAYWTPGFNPALLFGSSSNLSFYVPGTSKLYILGGSDNERNLTNVNTADTDHFDDSVIAHEYGHFIEDQYAQTDSPGGSHDANSIIDPRLAWGEGWADFFALIVTSNASYRDTYGNNLGMTGNFFNHNLDTNSPARDPISGSIQAAEGNFREFAITRALWDSIDNDSGGESSAGGVENIQIPFREFWYVFTGPFRTTGHFRDYGLFMYLHDNAGLSDLSTVFDDTDKQQVANRNNYGDDITSTQKKCGVTIRALTGYGEDGSYAHSNQFNSNDFYLYHHVGGSLNVHLSYENVGAGAPGSVDDLDLWVYKEGYEYGQAGSGTQAVSASDPPGTGTATENISTSAAAGYYLINVQYYTGSSSVGSWTNHQYDLTVGSATCP